MKTTQKSREEWLLLAEAWETSGLSQGSFCHAHGLKQAAFSYWRTQCMKSKESEAAFVALEPEADQSSRVILRWSGVELELGADADFVAAVLIKN